MEPLTETVTLELWTTCVQLPGHKTVIVPSLIPSVELVVVFVGCFFVVVFSQINSLNMLTCCSGILKRR